MSVSESPIGMRPGSNSTSPGDAGTRPVLAYLVSEDWYFVSHRLPMARAAQRAGYDVHVVTNVSKHGGIIEELGFKLHAVPWRRGGMNPVSVLALIARVRDVYRGIAPALVHQVALEPTVFGSLAAAGLRMPRINALAGLGFAFTSQTRSAGLTRAVLVRLLKVLLDRPHTTVLVQNPDDRDVMRSLGIAADRIRVIPGSGVDTVRLQPLPEPEGAITAAFVGRLLDDKGIRTLVAAHQLLNRRGRRIRLLVAGLPDPANPTSVPAAELDEWKRQPGLHLLGHVADVSKVWAEAHIAVLPSRREGLPKSLLEAAACGRPIVATDVPGCREIARQDVNALLVPPDDAVALADAIERMAGDSDLRRALGNQGRLLVEQEFSEQRIGEQVVALYDRVTGRAKSRVIS
jgi:glycosyltransferase involved in cell wall biosynthesis